jgi:hypothetical protein
MANARRRHCTLGEISALRRMPENGKHCGFAVEQFWSREKTGPISPMNVESVEQAKTTLDALPLVADGLMQYE